LAQLPAARCARFPLRVAHVAVFPLRVALDMGTYDPVSLGDIICQNCEIWDRDDVELPRRYWKIEVCPSPITCRFQNAKAWSFISEGKARAYLARHLVMSSYHSLKPEDAAIMANVSGIEVHEYMQTAEDREGGKKTLKPRDRSRSPMRRAPVLGASSSGGGEGGAAIGARAPEQPTPAKDLANAAANLASLTANLDKVAERMIQSVPPPQDTMGQPAFRALPLPLMGASSSSGIESALGTQRVEIPVGALKLLMHSIRTVRQHIEQLQVMVPVLQAAEAALSSRVDFN
jgi:hypothetical protein